LKDLDDVNEESVSTWLDDNSDLFGLKKEEQQAEQQNINLAALRQQDIVTQGALSPNRAEDLETKLNNAQSADEILALLRSEE
jgi:hypothetical protein